MNLFDDVLSSAAFRQRQEQERALQALKQQLLARYATFMNHSRSADLSAVAVLIAQLRKYGLGGYADVAAYVAAQVQSERDRATALSSKTPETALPPLKEGDVGIVFTPFGSANVYERGNPSPIASIPNGTRVFIVYAPNPYDPSSTLFVVQVEELGRNSVAIKKADVRRLQDASPSTGSLFGGVPILGDALKTLGDIFKEVPGSEWITNAASNGADWLGEMAKTTAGQVVLVGITNAMLFPGIANLAIPSASGMIFVGPQVASLVWAIPGMAAGDSFADSYAKEVTWRTLYILQFFGVGPEGKEAAQRFLDGIAKALNINNKGSAASEKALNDFNSVLNRGPNSEVSRKLSEQGLDYVTIAKKDGVRADSAAAAINGRLKRDVYNIHVFPVDGSFPAAPETVEGPDRNPLFGDVERRPGSPGGASVSDITRVTPQPKPTTPSGGVGAAIAELALVGAVGTGVYFFARAFYRRKYRHAGARKKNTLRSPNRTVTSFVDSPQRRHRT